MAENNPFASAKFMFAFNVAQKLITFALNQSLLAYTGPEIFGQAAIQLELLLSTLLFLSREGVRSALLREVISTPCHHQRFINLSWVPSCVIISFTALLMLNRLALLQTLHGIDMGAILMYCLGAMFEAMSEPWVNLFQNSANLYPKVRAETIAILFRSVTTFLCVAYFNLGVRGFGVAQMVYGLVHFTILSTFSTNNTSWKTYIPKKIELVDVDNATKKNFVKRAIHFVDQYVDINTLHSAWLATSSNLLKHVLTEADKIVLTLYCSSYDQGVFAIATNLGSLVARMLFLPLEDICRVVFARTGVTMLQIRKQHQELVLRRSRRLEQKVAAASRAGLSQLDMASAPEFQALTTDDLLNLEKQYLEKVSHMGLVFSQLMHLVMSISVIFALFGPQYVHVLGNVLLPRAVRKREVLNAVAAFCVYLLPLGVNGVSEAFVLATVTADRCTRVNVGLAVSSAVHVLSAMPLIRWCGPSGLVYANALSMTVRVGFNLWFINDYFNSMQNLSSSTGSGSVSVVGKAMRAAWSLPLQALLPTARQLTVLSVCWTLLSWSSHRHASSAQSLSDGVLHLSMGVAALAAVVLLNCTGAALLEATAIFTLLTQGKSKTATATDDPSSRPKID